MRNCRSYSFMVVLLSLLISIIAPAQIHKLYLNPKAPGTEKQSKFVDSIRFIPLDIKEGINLGSYNNMEVTKKYFLLIDYPGKILLLYAKNGRFVKKVNYRKLGEGFYPSYHEQKNQIVFFGLNKNYALTPKDQIEIRLDWSNPRNTKYYKKYHIDLNDTTFAFQKEKADENDIVGAHSLYDNYYWQGDITTSNVYKDSLDYELKIYKNKKLLKSFFPYNRINEPRFLYTQESTSITKAGTPFSYFISRPYCDTIYKMINDSLFPVYHLVMPLENSLPPSFFTTPPKNKTGRENFERNNGWMFEQVDNFYETSLLYYFSVSYFRNYDAYIYQKQGNVTYKVKNIKADSTQYNLQLFGGDNTLRKGDRFYKPQKAGDLVAFFEEHKDVPVPKELVGFIKAKPHAASPVIVEFKLKN